MLKLIITTLLWAFSFSLIGVYLAGEVDPYLAVLIRVALAFLLTCPLLMRKRQHSGNALKLMAIGATQLGLMYLLYYQSFELLSVAEVLVFTILTPIYVAVINDLFKKRFSPLTLISAALAVLGAGIIRWGSISEAYATGFLLVQLCNICFALGQILYRQLGSTSITQDASEFGYFFLGALVVVLPAYGFLGDHGSIADLTKTQWIVLAWLGLGASGIGYFLWNQGAREVNAGALAVMNNALVPAGLLVNLLIWDRSTDLVKLALGCTVIVGSLFINEGVRKRISKP